MAQPTAEDWKALEIASQVEHEESFNERLEYLQLLLNERQFRRVGSNVVSAASGDTMSDRVIRQRVAYSILGYGVNIAPNSDVHNSLLFEEVDISGESTVEASFVT